MELWNIASTMCHGLDIIELMGSPNVICIVHELWDTCPLSASAWLPSAWLHACMGLHGC